MKFIHRVGYYLGGFSLGLIILAFFLSGKKTSCDYGPNARTTKNISLKKKIYSEEAMLVMKKFEMDTTVVSSLIQYGNINFSESKTSNEPCKIYILENTYKKQNFKLKIENCDSIATIKDLIPYNKN